jgi:hypothetical protein
MRMIIAALLSGLTLTPFGIAPAQAAGSYQETCNSAASVTGIRGYNKNTGWTYGHTVQPGECWSFWNANDELRVDVDVANLGVRSWKNGLYNQGYGACRSGSPNDYNPADAWNGTRVTYRNYFNDGC